MKENNLSISNTPPERMAYWFLRALALLGGLGILYLIVGSWTYEPSGAGRPITAVDRAVSSFGYLAVAALVLLPYRWTREGWRYGVRMALTALLCLITVGTGVSGIMDYFGDGRAVETLPKAVLTIIVGLAFILAPVMDKILDGMANAPVYVDDFEPTEQE